MSKNLIFFKILKTFFKRHNYIIIGLKYFNLSETILSLFIYKNYKKLRIRKPTVNLKTLMVSRYIDTWFDRDTVRLNKNYYLKSRLSFYGLSSKNGLLLTNDHGLKDAPEEIIRFLKLRGTLKLFFNKFSFNQKNILSLYNKVYCIYLYIFNLYNINKVFNLKVYPKLKKTLFFNYFLNNKIKSLEIEYIINFFLKLN